MSGILNIPSPNRDPERDPQPELRPDPMRLRRFAAENRAAESRAAAAPAAYSAPAENDILLLQRVADGHEAAMSTLYDRYARIVYSIALRVLRDPASAEDILQEIFMKLWRAPESFVPERGSLGGWLAVLTRNRSIDALRRKRPQDTIEDVVLASSYDLADESERNLLMGKVRSIVHLMPPAQRKTLEMAFFDGLTHTEIAEMTAEPLATIKTRIRSALSALRKAFQI